MFLSPLFLVFGAVAATVPVLLHLLQRKRQVTIPFPTLRFLQAAEQKSSRRMHLENLLLWLLRTLILLLLGAAFAMPVLRARGLAWLGQAPRDVAVIVDASYSMGYQAGRNTVWEQAIASATDLLNGLDDQDRYCLYLAREQPEALIAEPIGDRDQGLQLLKAATLGATGSRLAPAIAAARNALEREQKGRERELHILTDGQAVAWEQGDRNAEAESDADDPDAAPDISLFVTVLGAPAPVNLSPVSLDMKPPLVIRDAPARIQVRTLHNGPDREATVQLTIGDEEIGRRPVRLGRDTAGEVEFTMPPRPPGVYPARVTTPEDALPIDNTFHFLVRVRESLPLLCVGTEADTLYPRAALQAALTGQAGGKPERIDADSVAEYPLQEMAAVFLCNALPLSGQALEKLNAYVRSGGLLVVFPGDRATPGDYRPWTTLPVEGAAAADLSRLERTRTLAWPATRHSLLAPFDRGLAPPRVTVRRTLVAERLAENARVLISQGPDQPFLVERAVGAGTVLLFSVSADRTWSDFPLSPFYLPLLAQVVEYSAGVGVLAPFTWTTDSLPLTEVIPGAGRDTALSDPDGRRLPVSSTVVDGVARIRVEGLTRPGIYTLDGQAPALAVNMAREESDLSPLDEADIRRILDADDLYVATGAEAMQQLIEEHRVGRTYGEHLLWIVLLLVAVEFGVANYLARGRPVLTDQLKLDASGRVAAPASEGAR